MKNVAVQKLAEHLNGVEISELEESNELITRGKELGLVVCYTFRDVTLELRGAIHDAVGVYGGGGDVLIVKSGILKIKCSECEDCFFYKNEFKKAAEIKVIWKFPESKNKYYADLHIETEIPHCSFDIMRYGTLYCQGLVFAIEDLENMTKVMKNNSKT